MAQVEAGRTDAIELLLLLLQEGEEAAPAAAHIEMGELQQCATHRSPPDDPLSQVLEPRPPGACLRQPHHLRCRPSHLLPGVAFRLPARQPRIPPARLRMAAEAAQRLPQHWLEEGQPPLKCPRKVLIRQSMRRELLHRLAPRRRLEPPVKGVRVRKHVRLPFSRRVDLSLWRRLIRFD
eukprot:4654930-Prymnesium_polylepis.2